MVAQNSGVNAMSAVLERLNAAMAAYTPGFGRRPTREFHLDEKILASIREMRQSIRVAEGGGGMCHLVSEWLQAEYGFERLNVTYLDREGEVIFTGHVVNILPDGSLLDCTADQIGEGDDIRLLSLDHPELGRYRPEFYEDYYPGHEDVGSGLEAWQDLYCGTIDYQRQDENRQRLGDGWWLADKRPLLDYLLEQKALENVDEADFHASWLDGRIAELTQILSAPAPRWP